MFSSIGYYSLTFGLGLSFLIFFFSFKNFYSSLKFDTKIISFVFLQFLFVIISFIGLILSFVNSDFSNETVFNHSHTSKPLFYKISGTWGNHEGSLLLWLLVLTPETDKFGDDPRVELEFGVGGTDKKNSSSWLLHNYFERQRKIVGI